MRKLDDWMKANKVSDAALASRLSVSRIQVLRIRRGENNASPKTARELESVTGIPAAEFVFAGEALSPREAAQ